MWRDSNVNIALQPVDGFGTQKWELGAQAAKPHILEGYMSRETVPANSCTPLAQMIP